MKIAVLGTHELTGGAAAAAYRLCRGLRLRGDVSVRYYVEHRERDGSDAIEFTETGMAGRIVKDVCDWVGYARSEGGRRWNRRWQLKKLLNLLAVEKPDVINLHAFNEWSRPGLPRACAAAFSEIAPVVWTLHDLWPLTGVRGFTGSYARSRQAVLDGAKTPDGRALVRIGQRLTFVGPSGWMCELASAGYGTANGIERIPYGIDTDEFCPMHQKSAREVWRLPEAPPIVLALSHHLHSTLKGIETLLEAADRLPAGTTLLLAGYPGTDPDLYRRSNVKLIEPIHDVRLLRTLYACADIVAVPSHEDNLPNVMLEALACGVPVVGAKVGGIPDVVRPGETGWLVDSHDPSEWAAVLSDAIADVRSAPAVWRERTRRAVEQEYALSVQADRYRELFERILQKSDGTKAVGTKS